MTQESAWRRIRRRLRPLFALIGFAAAVWWTIWRWMILRGDIHKVGGACNSVIECRDGPCLVHRVDAAGGLVRTDGYCSRGCKRDADCAPGQRCLDRPSGISRENGDHLPYVVVPPRLCLEAAAPAATPGPLPSAPK
jgi:hypothetical protein